MKNNAFRAGEYSVSLYSRLVSFFCLISSCLVLLGWATDNTLLKTWDMIGPSMNPMSAISILLCGTIMFLFSAGNFRWIEILSWSTLLINFINLLTPFTGFQPDQLLFTEKLSLEVTGSHMAFITSMSMIVLSIAFTGLSNARFRLAQILSLIVFFISLTVCVAYIYGARPLALIEGSPTMALNTALSLLLISSGTSLMFPRQGFCVHVLGSGAGAKLARRVFPLSILFMVSLGLLRFQFESGNLRMNTGLAFAVSFIVIVFLLVIYMFSRRINIGEDILKKERKHVSDLNQKLHQKNRELQTQNEELERFAQSVSHDIRSPLGAIRNVSDKMLDPKESLSLEEKQDFLHLIKSTSESMIDRSNQMLELAKAARKQVKKVPVNSGFIVSEVLKELREESDEKTIDLQMKSLPVVMADKALLKSVFYNLINNAVKYNKGKIAKIIVSGQQKGRETIFAVRDNGIGLDIKGITQLFKAFTRLPASNDEKGTGLGLSIVKRIVERHGGRVWAKPGERGGAVFYFSLPS